MPNQEASISKEVTGNDQLVTIEQMAAILQVKPSWIYFRTMRTGANSIPRMKIGKYLRFDPGKVMQWIETQYNAEV